MIIWGFGKVTRSYKGGIFSRRCNFCNQDQIWQLCVMRTWFTLFFIPIIPYKTTYCIVCPNCKSFIQIQKEEFLKIKESLSHSSTSSSNSSTRDSKASTEDVEDKLKYAGKNETQINFLKEMERQKQKQNI